MKGFFEQFETKSTIDPIYQECAGKLYKTLKAQGLLPRRYSPKRWASDIRIIFERVGQERAQKTFEYLLLNIRAKRMPVVRSGKSFKDKFESIEMHMNISQGKSKNLQVEVGDRARRIADLVKVKGWPKGVGSDLPAVAQISLDRYEQFVQDIYKLDLDAIDMPKIKRQQLSSLIDHLKFAFPQSAHFVEKWLLGVFDRVADWQGWSGDLMAMAFSPDSKHFRLDGRSWTRSYCGEPERWDLLMEVLNARQ